MKTDVLIKENLPSVNTQICIVTSLERNFIYQNQWLDFKWNTAVVLQGA